MMRSIFIGVAILSFVSALSPTEVRAAAAGSTARPMLSPTPAPYGIAAPNRPIVATTVEQCDQILHDDATCSYLIRVQHDAYVGWQWQRTPCGFAVTCLEVQYFYIKYGSITIGVAARDKWSRWVGWPQNAGNLCVYIEAHALQPPFPYQAKSQSTCVFAPPIKTQVLHS